MLVFILICKIFDRVLLSLVFDIVFIMKLIGCCCFILLLILDFWIKKKWDKFL